MARWTLEADIGRNLQRAEPVSTTLWPRMFDASTHAQLVDPALSLEFPRTFGMAQNQLNRPPVLEPGLDIDF